MSACLRRQLTASKPSLSPLPACVPGSSAAPWVRAMGTWIHTALMKPCRETRAAWAHPRARGGSGHGEPLMQPLSGLGTTSQISSWKCSRSC